MEELTPLMEARFNLIVEMGQKSLKEEIAQLKEQIGLLTEKLETLESAPASAIPAIPSNQPEAEALQETPMDLTQPREIGQSQMPVSDAVAVQDIPASTQTESTSQPTEKKERHPSNGLYGSEDVSIDKFFYFGNK